MKKKDLITIFGILILPLIYGGLYLWAFWDPYGKIEKIPVAVVNQDQCVVKKEKSYCLGNELVNSLKENMAMNWQFVDFNEAEAGLKTKIYYTEIIIPNDFSKNLTSVDSNNPEKAELVFKSRQATNFMASKFSDSAMTKIKASLEEKMAKEYIDNIFSDSRDSVTDLRKAVDGASDLADGADKLKIGSSDLYSGTDKLNSGIYDLRKGLNDLHDGGNSLKDGFNVIQPNMPASFSDGIDQAYSGSGQLLTAAKTGSGALTAVSNLLSQYLVKNPEATSSAELQQAVAIVGQLQAGSGQMVNGLTSLNVGLSDVQMGKNSLNSGVGDLTNALGTAESGADTLLNGVEKIKSGEKDLATGSAKLKDGAVELKQKLTDAWQTASDKTEVDKNNQQAETMSASVSIHDISMDIVENNGTGFAPYFIPLSLWVGAMAIFFYVDMTMPKKKYYQFWLRKIALSLAISSLQSVILGLVLTKILGLKLNYTWQFYGFNLITIWCFVMIQMMLNMLLGLPGKFVAIIILMLQLTAGGGTYPLETIPGFFQKASPLLPMTYAINALRELVSGDNLALVGKNTIILLIEAMVFFGLMALYLLKYRYGRKE